MLGICGRPCVRSPVLLKKKEGRKEEKNKKLP
jgi:hypothetical protein